jgi:Na+/proline symporter
MYTKYVDCHPLYAGRIKAPDQLLPLFVMDTLGQFKGLPGFFVAGIFSGALSTVSSGLNSLAAVTLIDFVGACFPSMPDSQATKISKFLSVLYGFASLGFVGIAQQLGGILQAGLSILGMSPF